MCTVYAVHEIDGVFVLCICKRALCCEDRWIVARVPASSQTSAPKMTSSNFGTKMLTFRISSISRLQQEQNRIMPIP